MMDLGEDDKGNKTIGISFPRSVHRTSSCNGTSLGQSNRSYWNKTTGPQRWWVTPLRIGISLFSLLVTFILIYWLVHLGNQHLEHDVL